MKTLKSFRDLLESPVAVMGDWSGFKDKKSTHIAKAAFEKGLYTIIGETSYRGKIVKIAKKDNRYVMGNFGTEHLDEPNEREVFVTLIEAEIIERKNIKDNFRYEKPIQIKKVETTGENMRGVGNTFYRYFLAEGYTIISDMIQFDGARKLYARLSKDKSIVADVIDDVNYKTLKTNVDIKHGIEDWDFDEDVWSHDYEKADVKIALTIKG